MTGARIDRTRATRWLVDVLPLAAVSWLPTVRWYGAKSRDIASVGVEDVLWLPGDSLDAALVVLDVACDPTQDLPSESGRYAAVIAFVDDPGNGSIIGTLPGTPPFHAVEAMTDPRSAVALLRGLATDAIVRGVKGGEILYADAADTVRRLLVDGGEALPIVSMGSEQSNTSMRVGSLHVFKLFRRLEAGEHPQLEFGRFLTRVGFRSAPPLEGSLAYRSPTGHVHALGVMEGWIASSGDGWHYVTSQLRRGDQAGVPQVLTKQMHGLGETTAAFHAALASDTATAAFAPEPVSEADVSAWRSRLLRQVDRTRGLVERQHHQWAGRRADAARELLGMLHDALPQLEAGGRGFDRSFHKIRIHGDFHLGQTLKTADGFVLIDFEGEPSKSLEERRLKQCALKDVAGLLRSLDYAWAAVSDATRQEMALADPVLAAVRAAFLDGYHSRAKRDSGVFLPRTDDAPRWTALFELEKALYEVEYEIDNRPDWVGIPLGAAVRLLAEWQRVSRPDGTV